MTALPPDPERLFGAEALADAKALRRAYAKLLREHGPEVDPAGFQVVQAAYEAARARLEGGPAPSGDAPAVAPDAPPAPQRDAAGWTAWLRAETPYDVDAARAEVARFPDDPAAAAISLLSEAALDPDTAEERALAELARGKVPPYVVGRAALALDPRLARGDGWRRFSGDPRARGARVPLDFARFDALALDRDWDEAWRHWREVGAALIRDAPAAALARYDDALRVQLWRLSLEELRVERGWIHDAQLPIDADALTAFDQRFRVLLDIRAAAGADDVPAAVREAVRAIVGGEGPVHDGEIVVALCRMRDELGDALGPELGRLSREQPVLVNALVQPIGRISGRWRRLEGAALPPSRRDDLQEALAELDRQYGQRVVAARERAVAHLEAPGDTLKLVLLILGGLALAAATSGVGLLALIVWAVRHDQRQQARRRAAAKLVKTPEDDAWADRRLLELLREHGAYAHELAALGEDLPTLRGAVGRLMLDPWADLAALDVAHAHRTLLRPPAEGA